MYMFNIRQTKNQGARRPRGSKSVQRSLAGRAGAAGTRVPPGAGCEKKTQIQLGLAKKMPILWKAWIRSPDHSSSPKVSNFSSEAAAEVSALPLPAPGVDTQEVPHGTHVALLGGLKDVLASGMTRAQPLGSCWKGHGSSTQILA